MTPLTRNLMRGAAIVLLILAVWGCYGAIGTFNQGEHATWLGKLVIWSSWAALLLALIAIGLVLYRPYAAARFAFAGLIAALPLTFVAAHPRSWCWVLDCSTSTPPAFVINGLLVIILFGLPTWLLRKV